MIHPLEDVVLNLESCVGALHIEHLSFIASLDNKESDESRIQIFVFVAAFNLLFGIQIV